jgi:WD40 repeat protein
LLWDVQKREQVGPPLTGLDDVITFAVAFSPDGKRITAGGNNQFAITWHLESGLRRPQVEQHNGSVRAAAFSPDGKILATASGDNTVLLSDPTTGRSLGPPLTAHRAPVVALAFNPDGSMLASGSEDRSVVLWDVQTRQQVGPRLVKHVNPVRGLGFSEDGDHLFSISSAFDTAHWDLDPATFAARCRARANRNMTAPEWQAHMGGEPYRKTWEDLPAASDNVAVIAPTR